MIVVGDATPQTAAALLISFYYLEGGGRSPLGGHWVLHWAHGHIRIEVGTRDLHREWNRKKNKNEDKEKMEKMEKMERMERMERKEKK